MTQTQFDWWLLPSEARAILSLLLQEGSGPVQYPYALEMMLTPHPGQGLVYLQLPERHIRL